MCKRFTSPIVALFLVPAFAHVVVAQEPTNVLIVYASRSGNTEAAAYLESADRGLGAVPATEGVHPDCVPTSSPTGVDWNIPGSGRQATSRR